MQNNLEALAAKLRPHLNAALICYEHSVSVPTETAKEIYDTLRTHQPPEPAEPPVNDSTCRKELDGLGVCLECGESHDGKCEVEQAVGKDYAEVAIRTFEALRFDTAEQFESGFRGQLRDMFQSAITAATAELQARVERLEGELAEAKALLLQFAEGSKENLTEKAMRIQITALQSQLAAKQ